MMATVRFSKVVQVVGKPFVHLLWMDPAKDSTLQKAMKLLEEGKQVAAFNILKQITEN
jgi:hypothetical protein